MLEIGHESKLVNYSSCFGMSIRRCLRSSLVLPGRFASFGKPAFSKAEGRWGRWRSEEACGSFCQDIFGAPACCWVGAQARDFLGGALGLSLPVPAHEKRAPSLAHDNCLSVVKEPLPLLECRSSTYAADKPVPSTLRAQNKTTTMGGRQRAQSKEAKKPARAGKLLIARFAPPAVPTGAILVSSRRGGEGRLELRAVVATLRCLIASCHLP